MAIRVAINGFGRIGRLTFRNLYARKSEFEVVAINDLTDNKMLATLLKYDSTHRRFPGTVSHDSREPHRRRQEDRRLAVRNPAELPWSDLKVDVVVESTGIFTGRAKDGKAGYDSHVQAGAKKVVLSAPAKDAPDLTCVLGVNDDKLTADMKYVSNASCTTNCLAPVAKVLHESFGIEKGLMTTVHAYTNDQVVQDFPHSDPYRARAAAVNIIPTTTGAAKAVGEVIPALKGKLTGISLRVPVTTGSVVDLTAVMSQGRDEGGSQRRDEEGGRGAAQGHSVLHGRPDRFDRHHRRPAQLDLRGRLHASAGRQLAEGRELVRQRVGL